MDPQKITELANLLRDNGDKILNSEFTLTLSGSLLRALNDSFTLIADSADIGSAQTFQVVKPINSKSPVFRDLQLVHDFVQKTALLCIVHYPAEDYFEGVIDISKFRALKRLEVQKTDVRQIVGIQPLRSQLQQLICVKSLRSVEDVITHCGGDNSNGFVWNELKIADFSYNNLRTVDSSLEFAQYLQHLNLRHNQLHSVEAIKWLPHLKTLDLSFNRLQCIPQFHMEAYKRLQSLNMSNNFVEDLMGIAKLDALTDLDLSDNCLLDHSHLLPLSALMTLKYLNLYGNPLHYHPKHRLATAQFLHKNTATVKFTLDFEPLSKSEKAITGTQQMRQVGSLNRYVAKSSVSINSARITPSSNTPASSVGSLRSFKFQESSTEADTSVLVEPSNKKRLTKTRTVEIEDAGDLEAETLKEQAKSSSGSTKKRRESLTKSLIAEENNEHLEAKKHIETLREKYGAGWLQSGNAEMMQSVLGIESSTDTQKLDEERNISRQLFNDFLGEFSAEATNQNQQLMPSSPNATSTPTNASPNQNSEQLLTEKVKPNPDNSYASTLYMTPEDSRISVETLDHSQTFYKTAEDSGILSSVDNEQQQLDEAVAEDEGYEDEAPHLKNIYSTTTDEEPEVSEPEDDEETYIVYTSNRNEAIFLTISASFLREKDTLTQRTKTKWSLKILESCERIKSNTLRINFDTVKVDKQERIYTVEDDLCHELEKKLRDILSQRDLSEMNQTIYRCVNCSCQFSRENKYKPLKQELRCPDCKSTFVAEIHDIPKDAGKSPATPTSSAAKLSPAAIVEESPITTPLVVQRQDSTASQGEDANSIGSANSLNGGGSSSCSKISNCQSSCDSNQSVAGSSMTERENDFKSNGESDVDILSNPSQSSIEVLDHGWLGGRKISEERRTSFVPNLETIDDQSYTQSFIEREFGAMAERPSQLLVEDFMAEAKQRQETTPTKRKAKTAVAAASPLAHVNLTESSSSGSVTDSICTAYEQQAEKVDKAEEAQHKTSKIIVHNLLAQESAQSRNRNNSNNSNDDKQSQASGSLRKEDSGISSMFGALFQSTNVLMSSSKKLIESEAAKSNIQTGISISPNRTPKCKPYKFNYTDFNDVDHRLKLYFYQTKFEEQGEHFKWIARGRIYNDNTHTLSDGIVVMSTCKFYLMEAYGPEHDDVTKWLRHVVSVTVDRLESIQLLPWKIGLAFSLRDWGGFLLLLQDILRTDSLLLHFANNSLPSQTELNYQPAEQILKRLSAAVIDEKLNMCSLLNGCEICCDSAKRTFGICGLLATDNRLYLTSGNLAWLSLKTPANIEADIELCVTQFMSNLVEVENPQDNIFVLNFLDETQDKCELWKCTFETKENAESCLNAIGQSWEKVFGVPLTKVA